VQQWRKKYAKGEVVIVRYADDFVIGFQYRGDAQRLQKELEERIQRFGLEMNSEKLKRIQARISKSDKVMRMKACFLV
jgi:hypothetical protein